MDELEQKIGYSFSNRELLLTALTHSSYANERRNCECNERLEFLGDSILGFTVAEYLFRNRTDMPEGRMTRLRAELVCEKSLHRAALRIGLGEHILLGRGEESSGGRERPSLLADAVEAIIAAAFLDGGFEVAAGVISSLILDYIDEAERTNIDYKTALQELVQQSPGTVVRYRLQGESGPDHQKMFCAEVMIDDKSYGIGCGSSKKSAEQAAARTTLEMLQQ